MIGRNIFFVAPARLRAAKRSFTPSLPLRKLARRRVNAKNKAHGDGVSSEERGSASFETGYGEGQNGPETAAARRTEVFPTGLVVSTHFRESSTGREILMLEVEKVKRGGGMRARAEASVRSINHHVAGKQSKLCFETINRLCLPYVWPLLSASVAVIPFAAEADYPLMCCNGVGYGRRSAQG